MTVQKIIPARSAQRPDRGRGGVVLLVGAQAVLICLYVIAGNLDSSAQVTETYSVEEGSGAAVPDFAESEAAPETTPAAADEAVTRARNKAPAWINFTATYRGRTEGQIGRKFKRGNNDFFYLSRLRLGVEVKPASSLRFFLQAQDSHAAGMDVSHRPASASFDLRQAYVDFHQSENASAGVRVGRQDLAFGAERLVGSGDWGNTGRSFDAVRAYIDRNGIRIDAFAASVVRIRDHAFDNPRVNGNNFYGVYSRFNKLLPASTIEPFVFYRTLQNVQGEDGRKGNAGFFTFGGRAFGQVAANWDYEFESAVQRGSFANDCVRAWAVHVTAGYTFKNTKFSPRYSAEYNFASGDGSSKDGTRQTFDQLFPTNHSKYGTADLVGWRNIHSVRAGSELKLTPKANINIDYLSHWLARNTDSLYSDSGVAIAQVRQGAESRHVGQEIDLILQYKFSKRCTVGLGDAFLKAGRFLKQATHGGGFSYPYLFLTYSF